MENEHKKNLCLSTMGLCSIYEDDPTTLLITTEIITMKEVQGDLNLKENLLNLEAQNTAHKVKEFLMSFPTLKCMGKVQVNVPRNNINISDIFANMNLTDDVASDRFPTADAGSSNDDYYSAGSPDASPSNYDDFNFGPFDVYISNADSADSSDVNSSVAYPSYDFCLFLFPLQSDIYPMIIFYPNNSGIPYPVYAVDYELLQE